MTAVSELNRAAPSTTRRSLFQFRAGSFLWLLRHELWLFFFELSETSGKEKNKGKRHMPRSGIAILIFLLGLTHFLAYMSLRHLPPLTETPPPIVLMITGGAMLVIFTLMLSLALSKCVKVLFERGDLDLLLSSPMSSKVIFQVRLVGIAMGIGLMAFFFLSPIAHVGLFLGQTRWLGIYPTIASMCLIGASLAMWATLGLVKVFGVRKTRVLAQLLGALVGAAMFIATQIFGNAGKEYQATLMATVGPWFKVGGALGPDSWAWVPAKALFGAPLPLLMFVAVAYFSFWLISQLTHQFFVRGVQQSGGMARVALAPTALVKGQSSNKPFTRGLARNVIFKEWRLIWRDPQLISQILLQLLYMIPAFLVIFRGKSMLPFVGSSMTLLSASLAGSLIWIIICSEEAPDLIGAAPTSAKLVRRYKLLAAFIPPFLLVLPALLWLIPSDPKLALLTLACSMAAMYSASLVNLWMAKPGTRAQFNRRAQGNWGGGILEQIGSFAWAGTIYATIVHGMWGLAPLGIALFSLFLAWAFRIKPD